jgi:hypothetical protein
MKAFMEREFISPEDYLKLMKMFDEKYPPE